MRTAERISSRAIAAAVRRLIEKSRPRDRRSLLRCFASAMRAARSLEFEDRDRAIVSRILSDPMLNQIVQRDDALGAISQAISSRELEQAYRATTSARRKFHAGEIPAVTQLFTPRWVVEILLQNSLGVWWLERHPDSRLRSQWKHLLHAPIQPTATPRSVRSVRILDPACGTMNFGIVAIEMLEAMYQEELGRAATSDELARNLYGIDLDPIAIEMARETIAIKLRAKPAAGPWAYDANLHCADALFDALPDHFPKTFDVVATNPPYLSARNLSRDIVTRMKLRYPRAWRDQYACFIERAIQLLDSSRGRAAMLTMQSFMFTSSFQSLRERIDSICAIESIAHFGPGLFDVGNPGTLQTCAFVLRREKSEPDRASQKIVASRSFDLQSRKRLTQSQMRSSPRASWCYWLSDQQREFFRSLPKLSAIAPPRQGLATTDNSRFVRMWWEVSDPIIGSQKWFPYVKSGQFRRWYESPRHRVNWQDDGAEIKAEIARRYPYLNGQWQWVAKNSQHYFNRGVTYSYLTSGSFSARLLEAGAIFDVAGSSLFPADEMTMLAILNSSVAADLLGAINPTVNFQVGDLAELPIPRTAGDESLRQDVRRAIELTRALDVFDESTPDFVAPMPMKRAPDIGADLRAVESRIERAVCEMYGVKSSFNPPRADSPDHADLARSWISHALGQLVREYDGPIKIPLSSASLRRMREIIGNEQVGDIDAFLANDFDAWHARLYQHRPRLWTFGSCDRAYVIAHDRAAREQMTWLARRVHQSIPRGWRRRMDDGIAINLAPLSSMLRSRKLAKKLDLIDRKLQAGEFAWSETWRDLHAKSPSLRSVVP